MNYFFTSGCLKTNHLITLDASEATHALKILRCREGEKVRILNGNGQFGTGEFINIKINDCILKLINVEEIAPPAYKLHIALANLKSRERMEWFAEKAVELGASGVHFFKAARSEKVHLNYDRLQKLLITALKQSGNAWLPELHIYNSTEMLLSKHFSGSLYMAHCETSETQLLKNIYKAGNDAIILIGPEGDFTPDEIKLALDKGYTPVNLGPLRLRAETAALTALQTLQIMNW